MGVAKGITDWTSMVPGARALITLINTLRQRGNQTLAGELESLASKQCEVERLRGGTKNYELRPQKSFSRDSHHGEVIHTGTSSNNEKDHENELTYESTSLYSWVSEDKWLSEYEEFRTDEEEDDHDTESDSESLDEVNKAVNNDLEERKDSCYEEAQIEVDENFETNLSMKSKVEDPLRAFENRIETFKSRSNRFRWTCPSIAELAESGFIYTGAPGDAVQCFSCKKVLAHWKLSDNPWVRHVAESPACQYVREVRGPEFIDNIVTQNQNKINVVANTVGNIQKRITRIGRNGFITIRNKENI